MKVLRLDSSEAGFDGALAKLLEWDITEESSVERTARQVIEDIRRDGDAALLDMTRRFDGLDAARVTDLELDTDALNAALDRVDESLKRALTQAAERIRVYHEHQLESSWSFTDDLGNRLGQRIGPLQRVGVYVPGGQASYPSSVLMTVIPAKVAGVDELVVTTPTPGGVANDAVLAALALAGADRVFTVGGAQAIAALAFGTQTVPRVDKIVGPGGAFVAAAKRLVFGQVGIDLIAGPSEVCVLAAGEQDPEWIAWDLFSQAEHDAAAQALLLSPDAALLDQVEAAMQRLIQQAGRADIIAASIEGRGALIQTRDLEEACSLVNRIAPEHLELHVPEPEPVMARIRHAGAIFVGPHASESLGDYVAGPSHVLPTFGTARFASPLGVYDFQKRSSVIEISPEGAANLADIAVSLANAEGLGAHAAAAARRVEQKKP